MSTSTYWLKKFLDIAKSVGLSEDKVKGMITKGVAGTDNPNDVGWMMLSFILLLREVWNYIYGNLNLNVDFEYEMHGRYRYNRIDAVMYITLNDIKYKVILNSWELKDGVIVKCLADFDPEVVTFIMSTCYRAEVLLYHLKWGVGELKWH